MCDTRPFLRRSDIWVPDDTYTNHRIPGMLVTDKGTLLIYCEARREASDWALMDILMQRSVDQGVTFSEKAALATGTQQHPTVNNPVMMQDTNGRIHFLYCEDYTINGGRVLRRYSDDDGISWSDPIDITGYAMPEYHNAFALGPGHGITTADDTLLVPIWMVPKHYEEPLSKHDPSVLSTFYSRDNGQTWAVGEILGISAEVICPNETVAALTSQAEVYLNIRHKACHRAKAYSRTGYDHWTDYGPDQKLWDPRCFGSVVSYNDGVNPYSIIFANCDCKTERKNITLRISTDDGRSYPWSRVVDADRGGYVDIAADMEKGLIYVLYEDQKGITGHFAVCNYAWIKEGDNDQN